MLTRICICGKPVEIPKITQIRRVKCSYCGSIAELKKRRKNNRVRGLKEDFVQRSSYINFR